MFQTHTRDALLPKQSSSNHMRSVKASLFNQQLYAIQSCLIGQISCEILKFDTSVSEEGRVRAERENASGSALRLFPVFGNVVLGLF